MGIFEELVIRGPLLPQGPDLALKSLCHVSQERWRSEFDQYCEDISAILIHCRMPILDSLAQAQTRSTVQRGPSSIPLAQERGSTRVLPSAQAANASSVPSSHAVKSWLGGQLQQPHSSVLASQGPSLIAATEGMAMSRGQPLIAQPVSAGLGQELPQGRVIQAIHSLPSRTASTLSPRLATDSSLAEAAGEPRKFLQAQPRNA